MNADGSDVTQLTSNDGEDQARLWSPDGARLAFTSDYHVRDGYDEELFVMNVDGTGVVQLTDNDSDIGWSWSPDGARVLIFSLAGEPAAEVFIANADGSGIDRLAGHGVEAPAWSPDSPRRPVRSCRLTVVALPSGLGAL